MKVYRYENLEDLNMKLEKLEKDHIRVLSVKIFSHVTKTLSGDNIVVDSFYIIAGGKDYHNGERFEKGNISV